LRSLHLPPHAEPALGIVGVVKQEARGRGRERAQEEAAQGHPIAGPAQCKFEIWMNTKQEKRAGQRSQLLMRGVSQRRPARGDIVGVAKRETRVKRAGASCGCGMMAWPAMIPPIDSVVYECAGARKNGRAGVDVTTFITFHRRSRLVIAAVGRREARNGGRASDGSIDRTVKDTPSPTHPRVVLWHPETEARKRRSQRGCASIVAGVKLVPPGAILG
jgi:hypothetical protein